jgi:peptide/nickel transport system permease protein
MTTSKEPEILVPESSSVPAAEPDDDLAPQRKIKSPTRRAFGRLLHNPGAVIALGFLLLLAVVAVAAPLVAPFDPNQVDTVNALQTPTGTHWLGTDELGRDNLSRLMYGTRISLLTAVAVVGIATLIAVPVALFSGYRGGRIDAVVMRIVDAGLAFPPLILALAVAGVLGPGVRNSILALTIVFVPGLIRLIRGSALAVREETFIEASRSIGTPTYRILLRRMFPNIRSTLIVQVSLMLGGALLAEAGLSYLGLGAKRPTPTWGNMLRGAYDTSLFTQAWQLLAPGVAIAATVFAFNALGDGLRDAFGMSQTRARRTERRGLTTVRREVAPSELAQHPVDAAFSTRQPLVEIRGLSVEFEGERGKARVVDNLDMVINAGEIVGLVGESGSGKSVTSLAMMRLIPSPPGRIVAGSITFEGRELLELPFEEMRKVRGAKIAMIFQDPMTSLDPAFTIGDQLVEAQRLHRDVSRSEARQRAVELLDMVGIPAAAQRFKEYPHQLSGGMRQRAMIAIALACEPSLLIADEPTTALDVTVQAQIIDLLKKLRDELGMAILLVTHDLGVIADACDRVAVMYAGQIVEEQEVQHLFSRPNHPYTAGLLGAMPQVGSTQQKLAVIPGQVPLPQAFPVGCRFNPRCTHAQDACREGPIELSPALTGDALTRCIRSEELVLSKTSER